MSHDRTSKKSSSRPRISRFWKFAAGIAALLFGWAYITGRPFWVLFLFAASIPAAAFVNWMFTGRLRRYRFLFGLYGTLALFGAYEAWECGRIPEPVAKYTELPKAPGEPNLYFEYDLPAVEAALFPDHPETLLMEAIQLNYCTTEGLPFHLHPFCQKYGKADRLRIRKVLEAALALHPKTNEDLYYSYIDVLRGTDASQEEVEAAIQQWKRLFPFSTRPAPSKATP